ncbi:hypothetical protein LR48_Vigan01g131700 [Vigna angularis]|uniref:Uncharacterized protein n=1 Tax=Phaseolus angularis TaxID=3914 RepID=A0A0L9TMT1_PHAAN|nr:hypothetical protein LR48_Vigan01g131700 [Vigna angularis]
MLMLLLVVVVCGNGVFVWMLESFLEEFGGQEGGLVVVVLVQEGAPVVVAAQQQRRSSRVRKQDGELFYGYEDPSMILTSIKGKTNMDIRFPDNEYPHPLKAKQICHIHLGLSQLSSLSAHTENAGMKNTTNITNHNTFKYIKMKL